MDTRRRPLMAEARLGKRSVTRSDQDLHADAKAAWAVYDCLETRLALIDATGEIVRTNRSWMAFAAQNPLPTGEIPKNIGVGTNYLQICSLAVGTSSEGAMHAHRGISDVIAGRRRRFAMEYPCHSPTAQRWFRLRATPLPRSRPRQVVIEHLEITAQKRAHFEADRLATELGELFRTLQHSASHLKALVGPASNRLSAPGVDESSPRRPVAKAWLSDAQRLRTLSAREREVLLALSRGERIADISARLGLSAKSVSTYRVRLMDKLKVDTTAELIALVTRVGVVR